MTRAACQIFTLVTLASQVLAAAQVPKELRGQIRAKAKLFDFSLSFAPSRAALQKGFWVGIGLDDKGKGYALQVGQTTARLLRRDAKQSRLLGEARVAKGAWNAAKCTLTVSARPRRLFVSIAGYRVFNSTVDPLPGDYLGVLGLPKAALTAKPQLHRREPPHFGDDFSSPEALPTTWTTEVGKWKLEAPVDPLIALNENTPMYSLYTAAGDECAATAGHGFWDFYAAEVTCQLRGSTQCGIVFYWQDRANHAALVLHNADGKCAPRLEWVCEGKRREVPSSQALDPRQWHRLRVEALDDRVWAYVNDGLVATTDGLTLGRGKVGLLARGVGAAFDDVRVEPFDAAVLAAETAQSVPPEWPGVRVQADAQPAQPVAVWVEDEQAGLRFECRLEPGKKRCALWRSVMGQSQLCGAAPLPTDGLALVELSAGRGGIAASVAGRRVASWQRPRFHPSRFGHAGEAKCVAWARAEPWESRGALIYENPFDSGVASSKFTRRPEPVIGTELLSYGWYWSISVAGSGGRLTSRSSQGSALWYPRPCPGNVKASIDICSLASGVGLQIAAADTVPDRSGYAACLRPTDGALKLDLLREARVVGSQTAQGEAVRLPQRLSLERDGGFLIAALGDSPRLVWRDPDPLPGERVGVLALGGPCAFDDLRIENLTGLKYTFERLSPAWRQVSGDFMLHSGLSCIPWNYWLTADGRKEPAVLWHRGKLPTDFAIRFDVSEITIGTDDPETTHYHFPYHDISLVVCADGQDLQSGYAIEMGADQGTCTRIRRQGKVVFETFDFTISMGDHCNTPRQIHVYLRKLGKRLRVVLNGETLADLEDANPLDAGFIALAAEGCRANFSDVLIMPE